MKKNPVPTTEQLAGGDSDDAKLTKALDDINKLAKRGR